LFSRIKVKWKLLIEKLKALGRHLKHEFEVYQLVLKHPKTPWLGKVLLGMAVGYLLLPFDLIPDFIPVLGQLDDVVIIPLLVYIALLVIPKALIDECRSAVSEDI
jgi:uncharacterized membrane protein YkvA (DUF1232 family)